MCYAIPGKIIKINKLVGTIEYFGEKKNILLDETIKVKLGDYVYAQGGVLIRKIDEKEALETLKFWKEKFFDLQEKDKNLSQIKNKDASKNTLEIIQKANLQKNISKEELLYLLNLANKQELNLMYETANNIRQNVHSNACCVHGIIEFSNYCKNDCFYCGIRASRQIQRYRLSVEEIIQAAKFAVNKLGFKALVLQSGEDLWYTEERSLEIIKELKKM